MTTRRWTPLITRREAEGFEQAIESIAKALEHNQRSPLDWGLALLHAYLGRAHQSATHCDRARFFVDRAVEAMATTALDEALYGGVAGVGWLCAHIGALLGDADDGQYEELDEALLEAAHDRSRQEYDLIGGIVGIGVYFLERLPHSIAFRGLNLVVEQLERSASVTDDQAAWLTPVSLLPLWQRELAPDGYYNLGVAHGVPGIVGFLAELRRAGIATPNVDRLLMQSGRWVINQRLGDGLYAAWLPKSERGEQKPAWCYGALGVSVALLLAARATKDATMEATAIDVACTAAACQNGGTTNDAALCHGAAGNGHLYNRLFHATGREEFRQAALYWLRRALVMRQDGLGVAGYRRWSPLDGNGNQKATGWDDDPGFLAGAGGIALAFLSAIHPVEPSWDRVMLADLDPTV